LRGTGGHEAAGRPAAQPGRSRMELWTCESCASRNAGEVCWKCGAARSSGAAMASPPTPATPSAPDPTAVPHRPATPSWSEPIEAAPPSPEPAAASPEPAAASPEPAAASPEPAAASPEPAAASPEPAVATPAPPPPVPAEPVAAAPAPPPPPPPAATAPPEVPATPEPPPAAPPPATPAEVPEGYSGLMFLVAGVVLILLVLVLLIITLNDAGPKALVTPATIDGLPQLHGAAVDALAEEARRNAGPQGQGMLVGVYGRDRLPSFIFVVVPSTGNGLSSFETSFVRGASQVGFSPSQFQHRSSGGVSYDCGTVQVTVAVPLSFCFFDDGTATGGGLVPGVPGTDRALRLTSSGRGAAESG
jgi:hypothetical protein